MIAGVTEVFYSLWYSWYRVNFIIIGYSSFGRVIFWSDIDIVILVFISMILWCFMTALFLFVEGRCALIASNNRSMFYEQRLFIPWCPLSTAIKVFGWTDVLGYRVLMTGNGSWETGYSARSFRQESIREPTDSS